jgi:hypothetical protein
MKLDRLPNAIDDQTIVRLYAFTADEAAKLAKEINKLAEGRISRLEVHKLLDVFCDSCTLILLVDAQDRGVVEVAPLQFECRLTANTWDNVAGLVEPFARAATGFQWLADSLDGALLLMSATGDW